MKIRSYEQLVLSGDKFEQAPETRERLIQEVKNFDAFQLAGEAFPSHSIERCHPSLHVA
jgi:hypothetical protein